MHTWACPLRNWGLGAVVGMVWMDIHLIPAEFRLHMLSKHGGFLGLIYTSEI